MQRLSFAQVHQAIMHNLQRVPQLEVQVIKLCQSVRWKPTLQNQLPKNKEEELERSLCPTCIYTCCQFCHKEADTAKSRAGVGPVLDQPHSAAQSLSYTNTTSFMKGWAPRMDQPQSLHLAFVLTLAKIPVSQMPATCYYVQEWALYWTNFTLLHNAVPILMPLAL